MNQTCKDRLTFSTTEKILAAIPFNASVLIGSYGLYLEHWLLTAAYLTFTFPGLLLMMRYTICPRCPHLLEGNDCLNLPVSFVKWWIAKDRTGSPSVYEHAFHQIIRFGILVLPIYWLLPRLDLLIPFVAFYIVGQATFRYHFCKNCANERCIQCRNTRRINETLNRSSSPAPASAPLPAP